MASAVHVMWDSTFVGGARGYFNNTTDATEVAAAVVDESPVATKDQQLADDVAELEQLDDEAPTSCLPSDDTATFVANLVEEPVEATAKC